MELGQDCPIDPDLGVPICSDTTTDTGGPITYLHRPVLAAGSADHGRRRSATRTG